MYTFTTGAICIFDRSEQLLEKLRQSYEAEVDTLKRSQLELVDRNKVGVKTFQSGGNHFGPEVAWKLKTKTKILVFVCVYIISCVGMKFTVRWMIHANLLSAAICLPQSFTVFTTFSEVVWNSIELKLWWQDLEHKLTFAQQAGRSGQELVDVLFIRLVFVYAFEDF